MDKRFLKTLLEDDGTGQGGISHIGETLEELLESEDLNYEYLSLEETNWILKMLGIKQIEDIYNEKKKILELANNLSKCKTNCENCDHFTNVKYCKDVDIATRIISMGYEKNIDIVQEILKELDSSILPNETTAAFKSKICNKYGIKQDQLRIEI